MMPHQFRDPAFRFIPLYRGSKTALQGVSGELWQQGAPYEPAWDEYLRTKGDVGVRLDKSGLIVIDCDTVPEQVVESNRATWRVVNGYEEFWSWLAGYQLCATLITSSPGRADGSHMPGWHLWFRQNENWKVIKPVKVAAHVDIKVSGIVRYTDQSHIGTDAPIATLPLELAKAFQPEESLSLLSQRSSRLGEYAKEGVNNALTALKGLLCNSWWTEEQANEVARYANQLLDDPMDAGRLERTVLREKGW